VKKALVLVLIFGVAAAVTLLAMGVFDDSGNSPAPAPPVTAAHADGNPPAPVDPKTALSGQEPTAEPQVDIPPDRPIRILMVARVIERFSSLLTMTWDARPNWKYRTFFQTLKPGQEAAHSPGLAPLTEDPGADALQDVDVVVLHQVDASKLRPDFCDVLDAKVRAGTIGLLVMPGVQGGGILEHPILGPLLPIEKAMPIQGDPVPGVFGAEVPFIPTKFGLKHPATRFVSFPGWSEKMWKEASSGDPAHKMRPWGAPFCFPVEQIRPGAVTLLEVEGGREHVRFPAIVQGAPETGRVLWVGVNDLGQNTFFDSASAFRVSALLQNWIDWLKGP
jgi:hypothetical protein